MLREATGWGPTYSLDQTLGDMLPTGGGADSVGQVSNLSRQTGQVGNLSYGISAAA